MQVKKKLEGISGIVLGGGKSRRLGQDKRRLDWAGQPLLEHVCGIMTSVFEEVIVVTAHKDYDCSHLPVRLVTDRIPDKGSLGGLYTGLLEATSFFGFVVACDMPFVNRESIARLCLEANSDVVAVKLSTGLQPLHARYSKQCIPVIEGMIQEGNLKIQRLMSCPTLDVKILEEEFLADIDPAYQSFQNINTPADLERARKRGSPGSM